MSLQDPKSERLPQTDDLRELRLLLPDARSEAVRQRVREASEALSSADEQDALRWIEEVSIFDEPNGKPAKR